MERLDLDGIREVVRALKAAINQIEKDIDKSFALLIKCQVLAVLVDFALKDDRKAPAIVVSHADDPTTSTNLNAHRGNSHEATEREEPKKFYAVTVGRHPGVFSGSQGIQANVAGVPGQAVGKFDTEAEALAAYRKALADGEVVRVATVYTREVVQPLDGEV